MKEKNVQPLRAAKEIEDMKWALRRYGSERDYFLFVFGINTGLRISDIVPIRLNLNTVNPHFPDSPPKL